MRTLLATLILCAACGDDGSSLPVDARAVDAAIDARIVDAPIVLPDAYIPDAPPGAITTACTNACAKIATCAMEPDVGGCVGECSADLADCSAAEVAAVDACTTQACGDIEGKNSPFLQCITAIACVDM
jgi:hypothetical protein